MKEIELMASAISDILDKGVLHKVYNINRNEVYPHQLFNFIFPQNDDYVQWLEHKLDKGDYKGWIGLSSKCLYKQIIEHEFIPTRSDKEGGESYAVNGMYIIADSNDEIIYIGKSGTNYRNTCKDSVVYRVIDHLIPSSKQNSKGNKMQNTPEIWDKLKNGEKLHIIYCDGIGRLIPTLCEIYLLNRYFQIHNGYLPMLNNRR